jgi:predicted transcriptional regulator
MSKAILMSIKPENLINILNHNKTLELRKSVPTNFIGWVYLYCTKAKPYLAFESVDYDDSFGHSATDCGYSIQNNIDDFDKLESEILNGKIEGRFWFDEYIKLINIEGQGYKDDDYAIIDNENQAHYVWQDEDFFKKSCLEDEVEVSNYGNGKDLYAWHIKNLEIFDKPMELSEFSYCMFGKVGNMVYHPNYLSKAPQSWQYVWVK